MKPIILFVVLLSVSNLLLSGCTPAVTTKVESVPEEPLPAKTRITTLEWKPTMTRKDLDLGPLLVYGKIPIALLSVDDIREDTRLIGKAYEDKKVRDTFVPLATKVNVTRWCKTAIEKVFAETGIRCDQKGKLRLEIEITEFSIFDDFTQTGTASLRISAHTDQDMLIWEGQIKGTSDLYVHETNSSGISECLSNTIMVVIYNMLTDQSFRDAVLKAYE